MRIPKRISDSENSNSVLYLALLCLLYLLTTSSYLPISYNSEISVDNTQPVYIEITKGGISTVNIYNNIDELNKLKVKYNLDTDLKSGDRIIVEDYQTVIGNISGRKRISLGVPIGINSASLKDLTSISGIGEELAGRIIDYRNKHGRIYSIEELDNVEGIGKIKLAAIKKAANLN
jgi:competence ComEA-like helix-hairpin-helix protein